MCRDVLLNLWPDAMVRTGAEQSVPERSDRLANSLVEALYQTSRVAYEWDVFRSERRALRDRVNALEQELAESAQVRARVQELERLLKKESAEKAAASQSVRAAEQKLSDALFATNQTISGLKRALQDKEGVLGVAHSEIASLGGLLTDCQGDLAATQAALNDRDAALTRFGRRESWVLTHGLARCVEYVLGSEDFISSLAGVNLAAEKAGFHEGLVAGFQAAQEGRLAADINGYDPQAGASLKALQESFDNAAAASTFLLPNCQSLSELYCWATGAATDEALDA
jgi:hypothetical protein